MNTPKILVLALIIALLGTFAAIGEPSARFEIRAEVATRCDITADDILLPTYLGDQIQAGNDWNVLCNTPDTVISVTYDDGLYGVNGQRHLALVTTQGAGAGRLRYDLSSSDGGTTSPVGQVLGSTTIVVPANQVAPVGSYSDTVTISVIF